MANGGVPGDNAGVFEPVGSSKFGDTSTYLYFRGTLDTYRGWTQTYEGCSGGTSTKSVGDTSVRIDVNHKNVFLTMSSSARGCGHPYLKFAEHESTSIDAIPGKGGARYFWMRTDCDGYRDEWKEVSGVWKCV